MPRKTLTQSETIRDFAEVCGYTYKDAEIIYKDIIKYLYHTFQQDYAITLRTIGTMGIHVRKPSIHHNVGTGKPYITGENPNIRFKTSMKFKETMRNLWENDCPEWLHRKPLYRSPPDEKISEDE